MTAFSHRPDLWPWALALTVALLGGSAGLIPLASLIAVQPLDEAGNPTPGWSSKVHVALLAVTSTVAPSAALLITGAQTGQTWLSWTAFAIAAATGPFSRAMAGDGPSADWPPTK